MVPVKRTDKIPNVENYGLKFIKKNLNKNA